jgi:hypothetical protein
MIKHIMNLFHKTFLILFILIGFEGYSQNWSPADTFPKPKGDLNMLFYLQRQPNTNTIIVDLNKQDGHLITSDPVNVYWIRYQEDGRKSKLNFIQREFAYGVQSKKINDDNYDLNFVSYKKMKFRLEKGQDNLWRVYGTLKNGSRIILNRIYVHINGGSFWKPNVEYVELKGIDPSTHGEIRERIRIK